MDFSTNIKFSGDLIENQKVTITYSGYLFQNNSSSLKIVYGFGDNWMYTNEQNMKKTKKGFVANIKMLNFSKFNFCFKNANNEWDNNYDKNFTAPISEFKVNEEFILNENIIEDICTNLVEYDISKIETPKIQTISESVESYENKVVEEPVEEPVEEDTSFEVFVEENEAIDITETIVNETINEELNIDFTELEETSTVEISDNDDEKFNINKFDQIFEEFEELSIQKDTSTVDNVVSNLVDNLYENSKKVEREEKESISALFESIFQEDQQEVSNENIELSQDDVEEEKSLIDETLNNTDEIEVKPAYISVEPVKLYKYSEELGLVVSPRSLNPFYALKKKVKIAFYKIFKTIPRFLSNTYNEDDNE